MIGTEKLLIHQIHQLNPTSKQHALTHSSVCSFGICFMFLHGALLLDWSAGKLVELVLKTNGNNFSWCREVCGISLFFPLKVHICGCAVIPYLFWGLARVVWLFLGTDQQLTPPCL